jgi:integrase
MASQQKSGNEGWDKAAQDLLAWYAAYGTRNPKVASGRVKQLTVFFHGWRLADIDAAAVIDYINHRKAQGCANATINADLAVLRKTLRVAQELGKLNTVPRVWMLRPAPPRAGFFEKAQFERVVSVLPPDLGLVVRIGYTPGWGLSSEVFTLTCRQFDRAEGCLRLEPGIAKNRDARIAYLTPELVEGIVEQLTHVKDLERRTGAIVPWLFPYLRGRHIGECIRSFRNRWEKACRIAGCPGMIRHDLRRTTCRNMINRGVPERVVMQVMGHKTRSMLDRYAIVSPEDLRDAARRLSDKSSDNLRATGDLVAITRHE